MSGKEDFLINNRFLINPALNQVQDTAAEGKTRLEPRVMQVLTILAVNAGKIVTREELIREIWNDYGGADEGLTQAVSFLRKVLDDTAKETIKTIPKKGYLLQAAVTSSGSFNNISVHTATNSRRFRYLYPVLGAMAIIIAVLVYEFYFRPNQPSKVPVSGTSTETIFPGNHKEDDHNPLNTITTTDSAGNRYRLVMIGDRKPEFYINDSLQLNQEPYEGLIDKLAKLLWKRQKEAENK